MDPKKKEKIILGYNNTYKYMDDFPDFKCYANCKTTPLFCKL